ncbi:PTS system mannose/fructose/N-acetylgalactosamine-transporter subunit IIB [Holdemania massiliensis]|uniref:PTS system mannose/fructose/N-acetylgalactosamine-transporter subunit IIB n=1 Tax=Holdemania massiliensis TaxID=1468449 RepID=UPI001F06ABE3|nr:PTS sugar transporter subunit IIB [Holdemania massiliensis]MCH1941939.1 PTS sugar transporter subunit IIB [Holdemania massiliensis]
MIKICRIDERLLHGQVAVTWVNTINPDAILVANDEIMQNEIAKLALKMSKPEGIQMAIRSIAQAIDLINNPETKKMQIFLLVKNIHDARRISEGTRQIQYLNLGRVFSKDGTIELDSNTPITKADAEDLISMFQDVKRIEYQMVPSEKIKDVKKILE